MADFVGLAPLLMVLKIALLIHLIQWFSVGLYL